MVATGDFKISASGRKVRRLIKVGDDDYSKEKDIDQDGDIDNNDRRLSKESVDESVVPDHMKGKQKPYVSSDGKGNYEVLGNTGQTKAEFTRKEHGKDAHKKAQDHLKSKYDEYMKEGTDPTPVAPAPYIHRVAVTVTDPDSSAVSKRDVKVQKMIRVTHHTADKGEAVERAKKHYKKFGWKVHGAEHTGMVHEETINEYSMEDLHKDAAAHLKKSIDKQSDDRIAALKNPPKKKGFFARVGEKQINMVKGAYHGLTKEEVEQIDEVLDMRHHTTGTGSIHVSHTHTSPSRVHSIGYTDAHKISKLSAGEKHEYKDANGHETFTAHKQSDGSTKIHDKDNRHVTTIKHSMDKYDGPVKESLDEGKHEHDKADKRFDLLARLGLVEKDDLANLRLAMKTLSEDKQLSIKQRDLLLNVYESMINLVTGDDTIFSRLKIKVQEETNPCWKGYQMIGMKDKGGKKVPNCVPEKTEEVSKSDIPFDGPYTKTPETTKDKSGAVHTPQSRVRHLARLAMKKQTKKSEE